MASLSKPTNDAVTNTLAKTFLTASTHPIPTNLDFALLPLLGGWAYQEEEKEEEERIKKKKKK